MAKRSKTSRSNRSCGSKNDVRRKYGDEWRWMEATPRAWRLLYMTRPKRRETKRLEIKIMKGEDPDRIAWPLDKKPYVYYW